MAKVKKKVDIRRLQTYGYDVRHPLFLMPATQELTEDSFKEISDEFQDFCDQPSSHSIEQFCCAWLMSVERFMKLCTASAHLQESYKIGVAKLLVRRIEMVNNRRMPSNVFLATLHQYSPQYASWIADMKKSATQADVAKMINVIIKATENSSMVPTKKGKK